MAAKEQPTSKEYGIEADRHWTEFMELAGKYGFIIQAYGGTATLATHRNQLEMLGEPKYLRIQQMNGHCPKDFGYAGCLTPEGEPKMCGSCWVLQKGARWVRFEKNPEFSERRNDDADRKRRQSR